MSATKKVFWKNQTFPSLSGSEKLVVAIVTAGVMMTIVTVLGIGRLGSRKRPGHRDHHDCCNHPICHDRCDYQNHHSFFRNRTGDQMQGTHHKVDSLASAIDAEVANTVTSLLRRLCFSLAWDTLS